MRHRSALKKLGRSPSHRRELVAALVCGLIREKRIETTVTKAKVAAQAANKMVTLALKDTLAARRVAISRLGQADCVAELFTVIAPKFAERPGGYTRIVKLGTRKGDGAEMALLEWVDIAVPAKGKTKPETTEAAA